VIGTRSLAEKKTAIKNAGVANLATRRITTLMSSLLMMAAYFVVVGIFVVNKKIIYYCPKGF